VTQEPGGPKSLEEFYGATYSRVVGIVAAICRDRDESEEAVQDAFVRLIGQWEKVRRYDDPEAWVRRVALGYLSKRRRKRLNGLRALARLGLPREVAGPLPDGVDLRRALAELPTSLRGVIILQDLGLTTAQIAHELRIPEGTVKSRLSRARAQLQPLLQEDTDEHV
jgi:RNA polymerase sigma factor (sigma-70 family)